VKTVHLTINRHQYLELEKIALGAFSPLMGFMTEEEFENVVERMRLLNGSPFPLPVVLDVSEERIRAIREAEQLTLVHQGCSVGEMKIQSLYCIDKVKAAERIYGTADPAHPGVGHFFRLGEYFLGGPVRLLKRIRFEFSDHEWSPQETRCVFAQRGWKTIVGFQTRNIPHRAHEYLLRLALEFADGLFIQPIVGFKQQGDYTTSAVLTAYRTLIEGFLPKERVFLGVLSTAMRYAGPREALFHALIRRNYGCTHFIIGRDHAGVGSYYGTYAAHELVSLFKRELGIEILRMHGPFYCRRCDGVATEKTCPHWELSPDQVRHISGTEVRTLFSKREEIPPELMRPEIVKSVSGLSLFIEEG